MDGRTDGQTDGHNNNSQDGASIAASRGKNAATTQGGPKNEVTSSKSMSQYDIEHKSMLFTSINSAFVEIITQSGST